MGKAGLEKGGAIRHRKKLTRDGVLFSGIHGRYLRFEKTRKNFVFIIYFQQLFILLLLINDKQISEKKKK